MTATSQCHHPDLHFNLNVVHLTDTNVHYLEIKATCKICETPMIFRGVPLGLSPHHPTGEFGGYEIRLPFIGEGEEPSGNLTGFVGGVMTK